MTDRYEWPAVIAVGICGFLLVALCVESARDQPRRDAIAEKQKAFVLECIDSGRDSQTCWEIVWLRGAP